MKKKLGLFNTDRVNRHGFRFSVEALEDSLSQSWRGSPSFISHDFHRLAGWTNSLGLHIHTDEVRLLGNFSFPETDDESALMQAAALNFLHEKVGSVDLSMRLQLKSLLSDHLSDNHSFVARECVSVIDDDIASKMFPELFPSDETDKRSLVDVRQLNAIAPGVFEYKGLALFAHRYFRRSLSQINNLNEAFLVKFLSLVDKPDLDVRIALDPHSIGLPSTYRTPIELQFWWGPGFSDDLTKIPLGITRHGASEIIQAFHGISHMDFLWHRQDGIQTLECEEVLLQRTYGTNFNDGAEQDEKYGFRYVHSMIDENTKLPYHLDGAIREYDVGAYIDRADESIATAGKNSRYVKLWRVDGPLEVNKWKELICHFYRDNTLAGEYLGADDGSRPDELVMPKPVPAVGTISPPPIAKDFGVHVMLTYHPKNVSDVAADCMLIAPTSVVAKGVRQLVMEDSSVDYIKMLRESLKGEVRLSERIEWICYDDMDINLPHLLLSGLDAVTNVNLALQCMWDLCKEFGDRKENRFITGNFFIEFSDKLVGISVAGFAADIVSTLPRGLPQVPTEASHLGGWAAAVHSGLKTRPSDKVSSPSAARAIQSDGQFVVERAFLPASCSIRFNDAGHCIAEFPETERHALSMVESGEWKLRPVRLIDKLLCNSCMGDYRGCACKTLMDPSSPGVSVESSQVISFAVTERPAS